MTDAGSTVAVDDGLHATSRGPLAADLAPRLGTRFVGVGACMPDSSRGYGETAVPPGMVIEENRQVAASGWTAAEVLQKATVEADADLIVSGGHGHSRVRDWFFGGVKPELLPEASICGLMRH